MGKWYITKGCPMFLRSSDKILAIAATETTRAGLPMSTDWKNTSYDSILLIVSLHNQLMQIRIDVSRLPRLDYQQLRLSLHFQVLIPPVPLSNPITVITLACDIANLFPPNLEVTCMNLAIDLIYELVRMTNLFPPDLVKFRA